MATANRSFPRERALLGLVGAPIAHSATPAMHEAAADALGLRLLYQLVEAPGLQAASLRALLEALCRVGFAGFNVTFPYKQLVVPLLDRLDPAARAIGAVNTVVVQDDGTLVGHNTDATGVAAALEPHLLPRAPGARIQAPRAQGPVALLGAGGVGRAAAFALAGLGVATRIFDTDPGRARGLADATGGVACASVAEAMRGAAGLFNGTPVGMLPNRESPVDAGLLHAGLWVADAVYNPLLTPLLAAALRAGARTVDGSALAIHQAQDAFALFTGHQAPDGVMAATFAAVIARRTPQAAVA